MWCAVAEFSRSSLIAFSMSLSVIVSSHDATEIGTVPDDIEYTEETYYNLGLDLDLSGNLLTGWPDQRPGENV